MSQVCGPGFRQLVAASRAMLDDHLLRGETPDPDRLVGWEFRGANTPAWASWLGIRKFIKGFYRAADGRILGYNSPVVQNRLDEPWLPRKTSAAGEARRFGFYQVTVVDATARDNAYLHAALLDYGAGHNPLFDPSRGLRDYLVAIPGTDGDLYLGKAYYALGPARLGVSFFVLERMAPGPLVPRFGGA